ncbi:hypothetical protein EDD52_11962 [Primorskyibacter sedentarius]|uniref:Uncharacterized protein n=1 Tax=Primorskyibacter sedentarius TaxID=745311 RepID=A0A4R3J1U5_9RHOB|nr:hypothetical protein EDD52_11962 [Primorskyibacter sedentarius]
MPLYGSPLWCSGKHAPDALPRGSVARRSDDQSRGPRRADRALSRNSSADRQGIAQRCPKRICFGTASPVIFTPAPPERPTGICQDVQRLVSCPGTGGGWLPWSGVAARREGCGVVTIPCVNGAVGPREIDQPPSLRGFAPRRPRRKFRSDNGLLFPSELCFFLPHRQLEHGEFSCGCHGRLREASLSCKADSPTFQRRKVLDPCEQGCRGLEQ